MIEKFLKFWFYARSKKNEINENNFNLTKTIKRWFYLYSVVHTKFQIYWKHQCFQNHFHDLKNIEFCRHKFHFFFAIFSIFWFDSNIFIFIFIIFQRKKIFLYSWLIFIKINNNIFIVFSLLTFVSIWYCVWLAWPCDFMTQRVIKRGSSQSVDLSTTGAVNSP